MGLYFILLCSAGGTTQKESYSDVALFCFYVPRILLAHTFPAVSQKLSIRKHINNVFSEGELEKENNTHFLRVDGVKQLVAFYSLKILIHRPQLPKPHYFSTKHTTYQHISTLYLF